MPKFLDRILINKYPCYFISPHLDDAALSVGSFMRYLVRRGVPVTVVNVFTDAPNIRQTFSAKKFVKATGFSNPQTLFAARRTEDGLALSKMGVKVINLGFVDAAWRQKTTLSTFHRLAERILPEFSHIYPIHRIHIASNKISQYDNLLLVQLKQTLKSLITQPKSVVFCPEAIGGHVDHAIVRHVVSQNFPAHRWIDQPYALSRKYRPTGNSQVFRFQVSYPQKKDLLRTYRSQISLLFPSGKIPLLEESIIYEG